MNWLREFWCEVKGGHWYQRSDHRMPEDQLWTCIRCPAYGYLDHDWPRARKVKDHA